MIFLYCFDLNYYVDAWIVNFILSCGFLAIVNTPNIDKNLWFPIGTWADPGFWFGREFFD